MAFSTSIKKGQFALSCQMCDEASDIKWKCLTCESFMCSKCCRIHRKVKSIDKHDIVDIKDIAHHSAISGTKPDFTNIICSQHKDQKCCLYCKVCEEVVCPICISKVHDNSHNMIEVSEGYQISLSRIKKLNSEVERDILRFTSDVSKLDSIRSAEKINFLAEKEKILSHEKAIKAAVEQHTNKLLSELNQRRNVQKSKIKDAIIYADKVIEDLESENKAFTKVMDSNNASEVFKIALEKSNSKKEPRVPAKTKFPRLPQFVPRKIISSFIESIYGILEEIKEQKDLQKVDIQVREQYTTKFPYIGTLVSCGDSLWISDTHNEIIQNVTLNHGFIHVNKTINICSLDIALTPSGDLLLSTLDANLRIIPHTIGKVEKSKYRVSPLETTAVHVSTDNKIIIGTKDDGQDFPASGPRQVVVMDMEGRCERVHQYDKKKKPLFTYPYKITTDKDRNIYVVDVLSDDGNGSVVVLGQGGRVRGIYIGNPGVNDSDHLLSPTDIVTTQSDNVIVSDQDNHTLHILNNNVQCVQCLNTKQSGIDWPYSLYIDNSGFLFIGCGTDIEQRKSDAKIHVVELVKSKKTL